MARQHMQHGQPRSNWKPFRGSSKGGRGGSRNSGYQRPTNKAPTPGKFVKKSNFVPSEGTSSTGKHSQWPGQMPGQSRGPNWERNRANKIKNRANKAAAKAAAARPAYSNSHAMASPAVTSLPLIARIGQKVTDFDQEFVPTLNYKYKGTRVVPTDEFMGRIDESDIADEDVTSSDTKSTSGSSKDNTSSRHSDEYPEDPEAEETNMDCDITRTPFASPAVSRHVSDDEGYNPDNDSTSESHHTSESHYSTDYEGQYTDHEGSEEEPLPEGIEWWSVHRYLEVNRNLR